MTLRDGNREYYYAALDRHFPGLKEQYMRRYANAYSVPSPNAAKLMAVFDEFCEKHGILHTPEDCFAYIRAFDDPYEQMTMTL